MSRVCRLGRGASGSFRSVFSRSLFAMGSGKDSVPRTRAPHSAKEKASRKQAVEKAKSEKKRQDAEAAARGYAAMAAALPGAAVTTQAGAAAASRDIRSAQVVLTSANRASSNSSHDAGVSASACYERVGDMWLGCRSRPRARVRGPLQARRVSGPRAERWAL